MSGAALPERKIILLLSTVSFINILDFMMVMPLGPDFARALAIPTSELGFIGGSYTAAAAVAGLVGALFLDRFDRRSALAVAMLGLVTGTAAGGLARGFGSLLAARVLAGMFGGPATSVGLSILADVVPIERRGKALGTMMGAFSLASVLGVPAGLRLAAVGGWRTPFFVVAALGLVVVVAAIAVMPPMRLHLARGRTAPPRPLAAFLRDRTVQLSLLTSMTLIAGGFAIIPNLSAYLQQNLGYPRDRLDVLYLAGGTVTFVAMRIGGGLVDRKGSVALTVAGTFLMLAVLSLGFLPARPLVPIMTVFVGFMLANALRSVAMNTLSSRVPFPDERARFMSAQSASQHIASSLGAMVSAVLLTDHAGKLSGMDRVTVFAMALAAAVPFLVATVSARVARREAAAAVVRAAE
jgi:predicted MFS family arabinose efflux permease